jgi:hypothetical protein
MSVICLKIGSAVEIASVPAEPPPVLQVFSAVSHSRDPLAIFDAQPGRDDLIRPSRPFPCPLDAVRPIGKAPTGLPSRS